jgi:mRNA interferase MazF
VKRGEVWWAHVDERCQVVILSQDGADKVRAMIIIAPANTNIDGRAVEVSVGAGDGLPREGVLRVALPCAGRINCNWLVTLPQTALLERAGILSPAKLRQLDDALRLGELE